MTFPGQESDDRTSRWQATELHEGRWPGPTPEACPWRWLSESPEAQCSRAWVVSSDISTAEKSARRLGGSEDRKDGGTLPQEEQGAGSEGRRRTALAGHPPRRCQPLISSEKSLQVRAVTGAVAAEWATEMRENSLPS